MSDTPYGVTGTETVPGHTDSDIGHIRCCQATVPHGLCGQAGPPDDRYIDQDDPDGCIVCISMLDTHLTDGCPRDGITVITPHPMVEAIRRIRAKERSNDA